MALLITPDFPLTNPEFPILHPEHPSVIDLVDLDEAAGLCGRSSAELFEQADRGDVPAYVVAGSLRFRVRDVVGLPPTS